MTDSKTLPIPFIAEMVRAVQSGLKTQTRRVMKPQPPSWCNRWGFTAFTPPRHISARGEVIDDDGEKNIGEKFFKLPHVNGDRLWVREQMRVIRVRTLKQMQIRVRYEADGAESDWLPYPERLKGAPIIGKCLSYGGYREASRLTLEVACVRAERLQSISEADAIAEGIRDLAGGFTCSPDPDPQKDPHGDSMSYWLDATSAFRELWDSINAKRGYGWDTNPVVRVTEFRRAVTL